MEGYLPTRDFKEGIIFIQWAYYCAFNYSYTVCMCVALLVSSVEPENVL